MSEKIVINPVTRISGFMEIEADIDRNAVSDARINGLLFRGFELMLQGRHPFDAVYFTERICGICSTAHSVASSMALESALGIQVSEQGRYVRDLLHGCEFLQNHLRHIYLFTMPDFVRMPEKLPVFKTDNRDFRLPKKLNDEIVQHYFDAIEISRTAHEMLAVLAGKVPHNHGIFVGGVAAQATTSKIIKMKSILQKILEFINLKMIPDICAIAHYYSEYYQMGGGYGNFLSYGLFDNYKDLGTLYVDPLTYSEGSTLPFDQKNICENIDYCFYKDQKSTYTPMETIPTPDPEKKQAYSWMKAPRYMNLAFEVGPLARQWLSGEYRNGISAMDRKIARALEAKKVAEVMGVLLDNIIPGTSVQQKYALPVKAEGSGLTDTTRGALGHWVKIENSVISFYQIITPSAWNLSSQSPEMKGTAEKALIGTSVMDVNNPVEVGVVVRSFDPCISCATHLFDGGVLKKSILVMP